MTAWLCNLVLTRPVQLVRGGLLVACGGVIGMSMLSIDNRFIDYFDRGTEIH